jgi:hypothetical protein
MNDKDFTKNKEEVIKYISDWIEKSTIFKVKIMELEDNPESIWRDENERQTNN